MRQPTRKAPACPPAPRTHSSLQLPHAVSSPQTVRSSPHKSGASSKTGGTPPVRPTALPQGSAALTKGTQAARPRDTLILGNDTDGANIGKCRPGQLRPRKAPPRGLRAAWGAAATRAFHPELLRKSAK